MPIYKLFNIDYPIYMIYIHMKQTKGVSCRNSILVVHFIGPTRDNLVASLETYEEGHWE